MNTIIIDGYNVINKMHNLRAENNKGVENARDSLARFLNEWRRRRNYTGKICVVFDGRSNGHCHARAVCQGISFVYSGDCSDADDYIVNMLKTSKNPQSLIVVSDDNFISNHCKVYNAEIRPVSFLLNKSNSKAQKGSKHAKKSDKNISPQTALEINHYLRKIWKIT